MKFIKYTKMGFLFFLIGMNISCDQITKEEVRKNINTNQIIEVIDQNLILTKVENTGAAMSLGSKLTPLPKYIVLKILPLLIMLGLIIFLISNLELSKIQQVAIALIIGGGIGNLIDRFKFGSVTDFMLIKIGPLKTGIFNMADVSILVGVLILLTYSIFNTKVDKVKVSI